MSYITKQICFLTIALSALSSFANTGGGVKSPAEPNNAIRFTENKKQWQSNILYRATLDGGSLFLEKNRFTYNFYDKEAYRSNHILKKGTQPSPVKFHAFRMTFKGANNNPTLISKEPTSDYCNFFIGKDPSKWAGNVKNYTEIVYENLYDGINFQVLGLVNSIKYNFYVAPMADASEIQLFYEGVDKISLNNGALTFKTSLNEIVEQRPFAYQWINGQKVEVSCEFVLEATTVKFNFPRGYDKKYELVVDPILIFAASSGSTADNFGMTATYDSQGHLYSGGMAFDAGFPTTVGAYDPSFNGVLTTGLSDVVVTKYSPTGTSLIYSTYFGGTIGTETVHSMIVNAQDELMLYGVTGSSDLPFTTNAFDTTFNGGVLLNLTPQGNGTLFSNGTDIYLAKFNVSGTALLASTYVGGTGNDGINESLNLGYNYGDVFRGEIQVDATGNFCVASCSFSANFPTTAGVAQPAIGGGLDGVVFKMNPNLTSMIWSTFIGGLVDDACYGVALEDVTNDVYVTGGTASANFPITTGALNTVYGTGTDGFVAKIKSDGTSILNSTYVGTNVYDQSYFVQIDKNSDIYILGQTLGNMPISAGVYNNPNSGQFIWKLNNSLSATIFTTRFGNGNGQVNISPSAFLVDDCENIYVSGWGGRINPQVPTSGMPLTANAHQSTTDGYNFYLIVFTPNAASLYYATYFGGALSQEHVDGGTSRFDRKGIVYQSVCAGCGGRDDFPVSPGAWPNTGANVNYSTNCNNGTFKFDFQVPIAVAQYTSNTSSGCVPLTVQFANQSTSVATYTWVINPGNISLTGTNPTYTFTTPGTYTVCLIASVTGLGSCNASDTACSVITVNPNITADFDFVTVPCTYQVVFSDSSLVGPVSWAWDFDDGSNSTTQNPSHTYSGPGVYDVTLVATNQFGCKDTVTYQFGLDTLPVISVSPSSNLCLGGSHQLNASGGIAYSWSPPTGLNNPNIPNPIATPAVTTTYTVTITTVTASGDTCLQTATTTVNVFNPATYPLVVTADDDTLNDGEFGTLLHAITPDTSLSVSWSPSNSLNNDSIYNPYASPTVTTTYTVTITDSNGCSKSATITIYVISSKCPPESIFVPNTFTPNGDGNNDILYVRGTNITELYFAVYNRWGQMVFETDDINKGWDGIYNGMKADPAVFAWYLKAKCEDGAEIKKKGNTTLIR